MKTRVSFKHFVSYCSFWTLFWLVKLACPKICTLQQLGRKNRMVYKIKIKCLLQIFKGCIVYELLRMPMACFSFVVTLFICFDHSK